MPLWLIDTAIVLLPVILAGVAKVVMDVASLRAEVQDIKSNHLQHIYKELQSMNEFLRGQF